MRVTCYQSTKVDVAKVAGMTCTASADVACFIGTREFIQKLIDRGHESVLEHIVYTFRVQGITRALLQELARHRHISLSVESTRWALKKSQRRGELRATLSDILEQRLPMDKRSPEVGEKLSKALTLADELDSVVFDLANLGVPNDVLKYFLIEARFTDLFLTVNARELRHIIKLRSASNALAEFQELVKLLYQCAPDDHKFMYIDVLSNIESEMKNR